MDKTPTELILAAFEQARASGKPDWNRMTTAVLKNRLLTLTDGTFDENDFGVNTLRDFVALAGNAVAIDTSSFPPVLTLLTDAPNTRLRSDLWTALMNYSSGLKYVWDTAQGVAREASIIDESHSPVIPTLSEEEMGEWRKEFAERFKVHLAPRAAERLSVWQQQGLPSKFLPSHLIGEWNREVKTKSVARLQQWFKANRLDEPANILVQHPSREQANDLGMLRQLVIECVRVMTDQELAELRLPPHVLLRIRAKQS